MIIWLASYPKSGNTWLRSMIATYFYTNTGEFNFKLLDYIDQFPNYNDFRNYKDTFYKPESTSKYWLDVQKKINEKNKLTFLKTHNALCKIENSVFTDQKNSIGAIYIVRDPRNVVNSILNHFDFKNHQQVLEFMKDEGRCLLYKEDDRYLGFVSLFSWKTHQKSWINNKLFPVLTIRYEDLQNKTFETFKIVIDFLNSIISEKKHFNKEKAKKVIQSCQFEKMKKMEREKGFAESVKKKTEDKNIDFFHLGPKNNYKELLNKEIISEMNSIYKDELKELKYD